jgi:ankyrin repeat protein
MAAAAAGDDALFDILLAEGANPAATNNLGGSVLMYAIGGGSRPTVERLLDAGVPVDGQASNGWTAMMMAAAKDQGEFVRLLGQAGADPNTPDIYGWTPLMRAAYENNRAAIQALLRLDGLDAETLNRNDQNALHLAVIAGHADMVEMLLQHDVKQTLDINQNSPQSIARELGRDDLLELLTQQGSAPSAVGDPAIDMQSSTQ